MNARTRQTVLSPTIPSSSNALWETPPAIYRQLDADFGPFGLDLTADLQRSLVKGKWLGPGSPYGPTFADALTAHWSATGETRGYSNPVYGRFAWDLIQLAAINASAYGFSSTLLLPLRITKVWLSTVMTAAAQVYFCDSRITFFENGVPRLDTKGNPQSAPFDSVIVRFEAGQPSASHAAIGPTFAVWSVPEHVWV